MLSNILGDLANATLRAAAHREVNEMSGEELRRVILQQQPVLGLAYVLVTSEDAQRVTVHRSLDLLSDEELQELAADKLAEALRKASHN